MWHADTTTDADRKQLVRCLIERVKLTVLGDSERVHVRITWAGGHRTDTELTRPVAQLTQLSYYPQLTDRIRQPTSTGNSPAQIAEQLNANGLRPPKRRERFGPQGVRDLMHDLGVATPGPSRPRPRTPLPPDQWWRHDLAQHLSMPDVTLGWLMQHRRLVRDYEAWPDNCASMITIAMVDNLTRRLTGETTPTWAGHLERHNSQSM